MLFVLWLMLPACQEVGSSVPDCADLSVMQAQVSNQFTQPEFLDWISTTYELSASEVTTTEWRLRDTYIEYDWKADGSFYAAYLREGVLVEILVWNDPGFRAGDLAACFGEPEEYSASHRELPNGNNELRFDLFYPGQGIYARGGGYLNGLPFWGSKKVDENSNFHVVYIVTSEKSSEAMVQDIAERGVTWPVDEALKYVKPWPGDWSRVVIEENPLP
jgi:hypothetical protein